MQFQPTNRGFSYAEFKDAKGEICTLQESSSYEPCIWLFAENGELPTEELTNAD